MMNADSTQIRRVVGCMTGTSLDGIDAALLEIEGEGMDMRCRFVGGVSDELGPCRQQLRDLAEQRPMTAGAIAEVAREFSLLHARVVMRLLGGAYADLICVHGQTVFHKPPVTWQLFEPGPLVHATQTPVVFNLRQADVARGGQGAPITPVADRILFMSRPSSNQAYANCVLNLGGFCNVTVRQTDHYMGTDELRGRDVCACNHVLDFIAREYLRMPFDEEGREAMQGVVQQHVLHDFSRVLRAQASHGRSLGTGDELTGYVRSLATRLVPRDLAATACYAIANAVRDAVNVSYPCVAVAGGGIRNLALLAAFKQRFKDCETTDAWGIPPEYREAACFAVLGALSQDGAPVYVQDVGKARGFAVAGNWAYA
jgi:anhydro-N-acetylmuramic acid kinase